MLAALFVSRCLTFLIFFFGISGGHLIGIKKVLSTLLAGVDLLRHN